MSRPVWELSIGSIRDEIVGEQYVLEASDSEIRKVFGYGPDDYGSTHVQFEQLHFIEKLTGIKIDLDKQFAVVAMVQDYDDNDIFKEVWTLCVMDSPSVPFAVGRLSGVSDAEIRSALSDAPDNYGGGFTITTEDVSFISNYCQLEIDFETQEAFVDMFRRQNNSRDEAYWMISIYDVQTEKLIKTIELKDVSDDEIRIWFGGDPESPSGFSIFENETKQQFVGEHSGITYDPEKHTPVVDLYRDDKDSDLYWRVQVLFLQSGRPDCADHDIPADQIEKILDYFGRPDRTRFAHVKVKKKDLRFIKQILNVDIDLSQKTAEITTRSEMIASGI